MSKILDAFDLCCLINLKHRTDRLFQAMAECKSVGIDPRDVCRVDGCMLDPKDYPNLPEESYGVPEERIRGVGCGFAHRYCIEMARTVKARSVLVLEDDVVFAKDFRAVFSQMSRFLALNEWDLFHFWSRHDKWTSANPHIKRIDGTTQAHCYAMHERFYDRFLDEYQPDVRSPIHVDQYYLRCNAVKYVSVDNLAIQRPGYSDIRGCVSSIGST